MSKSNFEILLTAMLNGEQVDIEPRTRMEQFLKNCCDKCGCNDLPTPRSRAEILLYQLAEQLAGGGGASIDIQPFSITENGTYTAPEGVAYSPIDVNVASSGGGENKLNQLLAKTITAVTAEDLQGVTSIDSYVFQNCTELTNITIPDNVTSIGTRAFSDCSGLMSVTFAENSKLTSIGSSAFKNCDGLTSINIPNGVTGIDSYAFQNCDGLTSITIPNTITNFGQYMFQNCTGLMSVTFAEDIKMNFIKTYMFDGCTGLTSINIPNSVTGIDSYAFRNCTGLASITIPNKVINIYSYAFQNCTGLTKVKVLRATPPTIVLNTFSGVPSTCIYEVPAASVEAYKSATNWSELADQIVASEEF